MSRINQLPKAAAVVIVGGGVIGLSIARTLAKRGLTNVLLIERQELGLEASFAAGGMLAPQVEADENDAFLKLACSSRDLYPSFAAALLDETGIDIELDTTGTLYLALNESEQSELERRFQWQTSIGLMVEKLSANDARTLEPCISQHARAALRFPRDIQVENRRLLNALKIACESSGVSILTNTTVHSLIVQHAKVTGVETSGGFVSTDRVVVAGGAWTSGIKGLPDVPIEPVRGQMLCFHSEEKLTRHVIYSPRGYLVPRRDGRLLAGSTSEFVGFNKSVTENGINTIRSHAAEISPEVLSLSIADSWAGLRPRAQDNLPVLGPCGEIGGLFFAAGHYRNGILLAPITAQLVGAAIVDDMVPPLMASFTADRFHLIAT
jgi:glycine oxidase